jgi:hypothetical protein
MVANIATHETRRAELKGLGPCADCIIMSLPDGTREEAASRVEAVVDLAWTSVVASSRRPVLYDQDAPDTATDLRHAG